MGSFLSKCKPISHSCYEVAHTWTPYCTVGALDVGFASVLQSVRIYSTVYAGAAVARGRLPSRSDLLKLVQSILQSTAFLSYNAFGFVSAVCFVRRLLGFANFWTLSLLPGWLCSFLAIFIERKSRRGMLATYVTNVASESVYYSLINHGVIGRIPYVDYAVFCVSLCGYLYHSIQLPSSQEYTLKLARMLLADSHGEVSSVPRPPTDGSTNACISSTQQHTWRTVLKATVKHLLFGSACQHLLALYNKLRTGKTSKRTFLQRNNIGIFLASLTLLSRVTVGILSKLSGKPEEWHGVVAGLISSPTYFLFRNSSLALYAFWKLVELKLRIWSESGLLPHLPLFTELVYATSTSLLFHYGMMEPHSLKKSYFAFLNQITGNKMTAINRELIDHEYGSCASRRVNFKPKYQEDFISENFKQVLGHLPSNRTKP